MYKKKLRGQTFPVTFDYLLHHNQLHLNSWPVSCLQSAISVYSVERNRMSNIHMQWIAQIHKME